MIVKPVLISLLFVAGTATFAVISVAQTSNGKNAPPSSSATQEPIVDMPAWATEPWTGNDQPYEKIEAEVDKIFSQNKMTRALLTQYQTTADKKLKDPQAQFRWYYASLRARESHPAILQKIYPGPAVLERPAFPHSYQYSRIGFLVETEDGPSPNYKDLGVRLLRQHPQDYELEYHLAICFDPSRSPEAKQEALTYAQDLIRMKPNDTRSYATLAHVYYYCWSVSKNKDDADKAISAYQQYLQLGPRNVDSRKLAENIIKEIQGG